MTQKSHSSLNIPEEVSPADPETCFRMLMTELFEKSRSWRQSTSINLFPAREMGKKMWWMHTMEYHVEEEAIGKI